MSSISSTQTDLGLAQFIQSLSANNADSTGASSTTSTIGADAANNTSSGSAVSGHHHHHGGGGGFDKIADAVTSALQASNSSSGTTSTDPNQVITNALTQLFQNGGLGGPGNANGSTGTTTPFGGTDGTDSTGSGNADAFESTLKSFGVTPQQFQSDLASALEAAKQNGSYLPNGAFVDTHG